MSDVPKWLAAMRAITGMTETPGDASNPNILRMRDYIAEKFPEQADYAALYTTDATAWCGLAADFCMAVADISGPFGPTDTDKWMWAKSWADDPNYIKLDVIRIVRPRLCPHPFISIGRSERPGDVSDSHTEIGRQAAPCGRIRSVKRGVVRLLWKFFCDVIAHAENVRIRSIPRSLGHASDCPHCSEPFRDIAHVYSPFIFSW